MTVTVTAAAVAQGVELTAALRRGGTTAAAGVLLAGGFAFIISPSGVSGSGCTASFSAILARLPNGKRGDAVRLNINSSSTVNL